MSVSDVARAAIAMDDPTVKARVASAGLSALGDLTFTAQERDLVLASARQASADVEGFDSRITVAVSGKTLIDQYVVTNNDALPPALRSAFSAHLAVTLNPSAPATIGSTVG